MNLLASLAGSYAMAYHPKEGMLTGRYREYPINITRVKGTNRYIVRLHANFGADSMQTPNLAESLEQFRKATKRGIQVYRPDGYSLRAEAQLSGNAKAKETLTMLLDHMVATAVQYSAPSCCGLCGENVAVSPHAINDQALHMCPACAIRTQESISSKAIENAQAESNIFMGTVGALLGGLVGGIVWILIYQLGYVAAISGLITIVLAYKGYTLFSKRKNISAALISTIMSFICIFIAHFICWGINVHSQIGSVYGLSIIDSLRATPDFIFAPEYIGDFLRDLIVGYIFMALVAFSFIKSAIKNPAGLHEVRELDETYAIPGQGR